MKHFLLVLSAINVDLENIVTPVKYKVLDKLLTESGYNQDKKKYLVEGFCKGFDLHYGGPLEGCRRTAPNLKLRVGNKVELWNKVMKEVQLGRYAGPFEQPPFENFVQITYRIGA